MKTAHQLINLGVLGPKDAAAALAYHRAHARFAASEGLLPTASAAVQLGMCTASEASRAISTVSGIPHLEEVHELRTLPDSNAIGNQLWQAARASGRLLVRGCGGVRVVEHAGSEEDDSMFRAILTRDVGASDGTVRCLTISVNRALGRHSSQLGGAFRRELKFLMNALASLQEPDGGSWGEYLKEYRLQAKYLRDVFFQGLTAFVREYSLVHGSLEAVKETARCLLEFERDEPQSFLRVLAQFNGLALRMRPPAVPFLLLRQEFSRLNGSSPQRFRPELQERYVEAIERMRESVLRGERVCVEAGARVLAECRDGRVLVWTCSGVVRKAIRKYQAERARTVDVSVLRPPNSPLEELRPIAPLDNDWPDSRWKRIESLTGVSEKFDAVLFGAATVVETGVYAEQGTREVLAWARDQGVPAYALIGPYKLCYSSQLMADDLEPALRAYHELVPWAELQHVILG